MMLSTLSGAGHQTLDANGCKIAIVYSIEVHLPGTNYVNSNQINKVKFCITGTFSKYVENEESSTLRVCNYNRQCLDAGKDVVKAVCKLFGGIYRVDLSGQTKMLVLGGKPGAFKVTSFWIHRCRINPKDNGSTQREFFCLIARNAEFP